MDNLAGLISISPMDLKGITERLMIGGLQQARKLRTATRELQNAEFETTSLEVQLPTSSIRCKP